MLEEMRIRGLGVIDDATLPLGPGLTVVTGETGAGKTMVVHGLSLLFGGRLDSGLVRGRDGAGPTSVEGRLSVAGQADVLARAEELGALVDDGELIVGRTVSAEGRSRAQVGGRAVPVAVLAELAEPIVSVHGQADQHRLTRPTEQRAALDRFAGTTAGPLAAYRAAFTRLGVARAELAELTARQAARAQEAELLRLGLADIAGIAPQPGEDVALSTEIARLTHADVLRGAAQQAHDALMSDGAAARDVDASALVDAARRATATGAEHDPQLGALAARLSDIGYQLADVAAELAAYAADVEVDPARLDTAHERQSALGALLRRYAPTLEGVLAWVEGAEQRVLEVSGDDERVAQLQVQTAELLSELAQHGAEISAARADAAARFSAAVSAELGALAMPHADVHFVVEQVEDDDGLVMGGRRLAFGPDGVDTIDLLLSAHRGAPARPLARAASGGELSRIMLAIAVVLAESDPVPLMVFDEVDAGVGGRAAVEVGSRLARLARTHQVLVVTHLPQVAAFGDAHIRVVKDQSGAVTVSGVERLDEAGRVAELSRMLAGLEESDLAHGHAAELLAVATSTKARG